MHHCTTHVQALQRTFEHRDDVESIPNELLNVAQYTFHDIATRGDAGALACMYVCTPYVV